MGSWAKSAHSPNLSLDCKASLAHKGTSTRPAKPGLVDGNAKRPAQSCSVKPRVAPLRGANMPPFPPPQSMRVKKRGRRGRHVCPLSRRRNGLSSLFFKAQAYCLLNTKPPPGTCPQGRVAVSRRNRQQPKAVGGKR